MKLFDSLQRFSSSKGRLVSVGFACLMLAGSIAARAQTQQPAAGDAQPVNSALPNIFIVGDSTAAYHTDATAEGMSGVQGWGVFLPGFINAAKFNVVNVARGGRSSRTYQTEGIWETVKKRIRPGDFVLIQLGHNDVFPVNDDSRARGTIPGIGPETQEIDNLVTHKHETVHTYGWYLTKYVEDVKAIGATPIVLSLTIRNVWKDGKIEMGVSEYRKWAHAVADQQKVDFVDVTAIMGQELTRFGEQKTSGLFHSTEMVHTTVPGGYFAAQCVVAGLKAIPDLAINQGLSAMGTLVAPVRPTVP